MMNKQDRGQKHLCPECGCKYYDLNKKVVTCPKCEAKPAPRKLQKSGRPARSGRGFASRKAS